ncbi:MAG: hypothetical protein JW891_10930 [Candidatus Lokiarchaeota archaeon]|nr:hypothetical protein [Candidatus Lokiarchaeota archaeon]
MSKKYERKIKNLKEHEYDTEMPLDLEHDYDRVKGREIKEEPTFMTNFEDKNKSRRNSKEFKKKMQRIPTKFEKSKKIW